MQSIVNKKVCTGCSACYNICPRKCIEMKQDKEGFLYPIINKEQCISCGKCEKVCPVLHEYEPENNYKKPEIYAAWSLDEENRIMSTSGGVFSEIAKVVIDSGGSVIGARYNEKHLVEHFCIDKTKDISILRQSKYIQSDKGLIFQQTKNLLENRKKVLFVGAPCEVAGLAKFLNKEYEDLILCDFVCRGTNSPMVYEKYLKSLEKRYCSKVKRVWFKNKTYGWNRFSTKIEFENGQSYIQDRNTDPFMQGYIEYNLYMRPCCENCKFKQIPRKSDITLADFWRIGEVNPELDENKGTSMVVLNSDKGRNLFFSIQNRIFCQKSNFETAYNGNKSLLCSTKMNGKRNNFFKELEHGEFDEVIKKYINQDFFGNLKKFMRRCVLKLNRMRNRNQ